MMVFYKYIFNNKASNICIFPLMLVVMLFLNSCHDEYYRTLTIQNISDTTISIIGAEYVDSVNIRDMIYGNPGAQSYAPAVIPFGTSKECLHTAFDKAPEKEHRICTIYVFKTSTLQKYTWKEIKDGDIYDAAAFLSTRELENRNWLVVYPDDFEPTPHTDARNGY